ncbi:hypothetical protein [Cellvibrio sp.]|jgi:hypothetical protein
MKQFHKLLGLGALTLMLSHAVWAADSIGNAAASVKHSGKAIKHGAVASGQLVSGAVAVPLVVVGELGKASGKAGEALMDVATDKQPLEISDANITAEPAPAVVMADAHNKSANIDSQKLR